MIQDKIYAMDMHSYCNGGHYNTIIAYADNILQLQEHLLNSDSVLQYRIGNNIETEFYQSWKESDFDDDQIEFKINDRDASYIYRIYPIQLLNNIKENSDEKTQIHKTIRPAIVNQPC